MVWVLVGVGIGLAWFVVASALALVLCQMIRRAEEAEDRAARVDPDPDLSWPVDTARTQAGSRLTLR